MTMEARHRSASALTSGSTHNTPAHAPLFESDSMLRPGGARAPARVEVQLEPGASSGDDVVTVLDDSDDNRKLWKCDVCGKTFNRRSYLVRHAAWHQRPPPERDAVYCRHCRRNISRVNFNVHTRAHRTHRCDLCERSYSLRAALARHVRDAHAGEGPVRCGVCGNAFLTEHGLSAHVRIVHLRSEPDVKRESGRRCEPCGKEFATKRQYDKHRQKVHPACKVRCDRCPKEYKSKEHLKRHVVSMHLARVWTSRCECGQRFPSAEHLARHRAGGHKARGRCRRCGRRFRSEALLRRHRLRAHAAHVFECDACSKLLTSKDSMVKHIATYHPFREPWESQYPKPLRTYSRTDKIDSKAK